MSFNIVTNVKGKMKDNQNTRIDLTELCVCGELQLVLVTKRKVSKAKCQLHVLGEIC